MNLIPRPDLTIADEELLAAQAIARTTGSLSVELIDSYIAKLQEVRKLVEDGNLVTICPELTNAAPSAPHTVLLEAQAWLLAQMAYRINQIPEQNLIEFARLFQIELKPATAAQTTLRFTVSGNSETITVPAGTQVATDDETIIFETLEDLIVPTSTTGEVVAQNLQTGHLLLASDKLSKILNNIIFVEAATNPTAIDSGSETESIESALLRMRSLQRRGERIVSAKDLEDAVLYDALNGNGIVRAFPFIKDFQSPPVPGHTTLVVMTRNGEPINSLSLQKIGKLLNQIVGNQFVFVSNPYFKEFSVSATIKIDSIAVRETVVQVVENNLRNFYHASRENFGRAVLRSEIIAVIEGTSGVDRIVSPSYGQILDSPRFDLKLANYEIPKLVSVNLNVV